MAFYKISSTKKYKLIENTAHEKTKRFPMKKMFIQNKHQRAVFIE